MLATKISLILLYEVSREWTRVSTWGAAEASGWLSLKLLHDPTTMAARSGWADEDRTESYQKTEKRV